MYIDERQDKEVQQDIKVGLMAFKKLAKERLKERWKYLSLEQRVEAARSLVFMEHVAKDPKKYFSREQTYDAWIARAEKYAETHNFKNIRDAFYIVEGPKEIVWNASMHAMWNTLSHKYYHFLEAIVNYEYSEDSWHKEMEFEKIREISKPVINIVDILESKPVVKQWKHFKRNIGLTR